MSYVAGLRPAPSKDIFHRLFYKENIIPFYKLKIKINYLYIIFIFYKINNYMLRECFYKMC